MSKDGGFESYDTLFLAALGLLIFKDELSGISVVTAGYQVSLLSLSVVFVMLLFVFSYLKALYHLLHVFFPESRRLNKSFDFALQLIIVSAVLYPILIVCLVIFDKYTAGLSFTHVLALGFLTGLVTTYIFIGMKDNLEVRQAIEELERDRDGALEVWTQTYKNEDDSVLMHRFSESHDKLISLLTLILRQKGYRSPFKSEADLVNLLKENNLINDYEEVRLNRMILFRDGVRHRYKTNIKDFVKILKVYEEFIDSFKARYKD